MLEDEIKNLKHRLIEYATLVESMIDKSIKGLLDKEEKYLKEVMEKDEAVANDFEIELDELCTITIAQHQPVAIDLRTILMVLKMNNDLERIGDLATKISKYALLLIQKPSLKPLLDTPRMAQKTIEMLKDSIESFINEDVKLAKSVCEKDHIVDELRDQILRELITYMSADTTTIPKALRLLQIARLLERIADLSTNICEDVIFMVEGRIIKHHHEEEQE